MVVDIRIFAGNMRAGLKVRENRILELNTFFWDDTHAPKTSGDYKSANVEYNNDEIVFVLVFWKM
jgi:hypothetical protein